MKKNSNSELESEPEVPRAGVVGNTSGLPSALADGLRMQLTHKGFSPYYILVPPSLSPPSGRYHCSAKACCPPILEARCTVG